MRSNHVDLMLADRPFWIGGPKGFGQLEVKSQGPGHVGAAIPLFKHFEKLVRKDHAPEDAPAEDLLKITERIEKLAVELRF